MFCTQSLLTGSYICLVTLTSSLEGLTVCALALKSYFWDTYKDKTCFINIAQCLSKNKSNFLYFYRFQMRFEYMMGNVTASTE